MLRIDLREGFSGDTVVVRAGGRELLRREGVSTDYSVGLAASLELDVPEGVPEVEVELPERGIRGAAPVPPGAAVLACAVSPEGRLTCSALAEPPLYM
jgi:hypothetical protein